MPLANAIGIYLLAGTVLQGLGLMTKAGWVASGKLKPSKMGKHGNLYFVIGTVIGVLFWPVFLVVITIAWRMKRRTRKLERFLGYCEHSTALEPICGPCSRAIERESASAAQRYVVSGKPLNVRGLRSVEEAKILLVGTLRRLNDAEGKFREKVAAYIKAHPECLKCGKAGGLSQYLDSIWVKCSVCGRLTYIPDPSASEEVGMGQVVPTNYKCSVCGEVSDGFPAAMNAEGYPLCGPCSRGLASP